MASQVGKKYQEQYIVILGYSGYTLPIECLSSLKFTKEKIEIHLKKEFLSTLSVVATITTSEEFFPSFLSFSLKFTFHNSMLSRIGRRKELFNSTFSSNFKLKVTFEPETLILT